MKFLSITGPKEDIDRVVNLYLSKYEIHIENALSELKTVKDLRPYIEINPYKELFTRLPAWPILSMPMRHPGTKIHPPERISPYGFWPAGIFQSKRPLKPYSV